MVDSYYDTPVPYVSQPRTLLIVIDVNHGRLELASWSTAFEQDVNLTV